MKRSFLMIFILVMIVIPFSTVSAFNPDQPGPHVMADLMPDTVEIFAATRIGEDFIQELDAITTALYAKLPASLAVAEPYTIDRTARLALADEGLDWDALKGLMGNYAAIGVVPVGGFEEEPDMIMVIEITDQAGVEDYLLSVIPEPDEDVQREMVGDTIVYSDNNDPMKVMISPTHFVISTRPDYDPASVASPLSTAAGFTGALNNLPADQYNMLAYMSEATMEAMLSQGDAAELQQMGIDPADAGAVTIGATILAGNTFTIDVAAQTAAPVPTSTVNLDFLSAMPGNTDAFIVATDLTNVYNSVTATIRAVAEENGEEDPTAQIPLMFNFTGLDLEDDVLSWTTGSYGVFFGADFMTILEEAMSTGTVSELNFEAGIVIEATDVAKAQAAAAQLGETLTAMVANEEDVTITQSEVNGTAITSIIASTPLDPSMPPIDIEFVLTATEDFFFFGTRSAFDAVMSGDTLASNSDFGKSTQYLLDNSTSVWYTNSDGVIVSSVIPLAIMGPAVGNVFENVIAELESEPMMEPTPLGGSTDDSSDDADSDTDMSDSSSMNGEFDIIMDVLSVYDEILSSMTISTSVDTGGIVRFRATMSVNP